MRLGCPSWVGDTGPSRCDRCGCRWHRQWTELLVSCSNGFHTSPRVLSPVSSPGSRAPWLDMQPFGTGGPPLLARLVSAGGLWGPDSCRLTLRRHCSRGSPVPSPVSSRGLFPPLSRCLGLLGGRGPVCACPRGGSCRLGLAGALSQPALCSQVHLVSGQTAF